MNINSSTQKVIGSLLRWLPFLFYVSWVVVGYRILLENQASRPALLRYVATGKLPTNHLLRSEDILVDASLPLRDRVWLPKSSEFEGKYIAKTIYQGQSVELANLRPSPVVIPSSNNVAYVYSLQHQPSLGDILNAGAIVGICSATCSNDSARVLAVVCAASKTKDCSAVLDLSPAQSALFSDPAKVQLVLK